jgi:type III secretory pathway component EscT
MTEKISNLLLGVMLGYFMSTSFFAFSTGVIAGVIIQEQYGSVYKFSLFCYDVSTQYLSNYKSKFKPTIFSNKSFKDKTSVE